MKNISVPTKRGVLLNGALFGGGAETVVIAITGILHTEPLSQLAGIFNRRMVFFIQRSPIKAHSPQTPPVPCLSRSYLCPFLSLSLMC